MTIITYKDGWAFADELIWGSGTIVGRGHKLAWRKKDGAIIGATGPAHSCQRFIDAMLDGKGDDANGTLGDQACEGFVILPDTKTVQEFGGKTKWSMYAETFAAGAAEDIATGALHAGMSAKEACIIACNALGWPTGIHGVNHDGVWDFVEMEDVFRPVHSGFSARHSLTVGKKGTY